MKKPLSDKAQGNWLAVLRDEWDAMTPEEKEARYLRDFTEYIQRAVTDCWPLAASRTPLVQCLRSYADFLEAQENNRGPKLVKTSR